MKFNNFFIFVAIIFLSSILNHGTLGGDEGTMFNIVYSIRQSDLSFFEYIVNKPPNEILQRHILWVGLMYFQVLIIDNIFDFLYSSPPKFLYDWILSFFPCLAAVSSILFIYKSLIAFGYSRYVAYVSILLIYICSPISSLMTGGWVECYLLLLLSLKFYLSSKYLGDDKHFAIYGFIDSLIVGFKFYAIFFTLTYFLLNIKYISKLNISKYLLWFFIPLIILTFIRLLNSIDSSSNIFGENIRLPDIGYYFHNLIGSTISFTFGLIFLPASLIIIFNYKKINYRKALYKLIIPITILLLFLCLYPFWHGALGVAGQRYIAPFLILLTPYVAEVISKLKVTFTNRVLIGFLVIFYINSIDYRNTLADVYANNPSLSANNMRFAHENFPYFSPIFQPAIFGNLIYYYVNFSHTNSLILNNSKNEKISININSVIPMSGLSRAIYISSSQNVTNKKFTTYSAFSAQKNLSIALLLLKFFICILLFLSIIFISNKKLNEYL